MKFIVSEKDGTKRLIAKKEGKDTRLDTFTFLGMIVLSALFWISGNTFLKFSAIVLIIYNFFRWLAVNGMEKTKIEYIPEEKAVIENSDERYSIENADKITIYKVHEKFWKKYKPVEAKVHSSGGSSSSDSFLVDFIFMIFSLIFINLIELLLYVCRTILHFIRPPAMYYVASIGSKALLYFRTYGGLNEEELKNKLEELLGVETIIRPEPLRDTFAEFAKFVFIDSLESVEFVI